MKSVELTTINIAKNDNEKKTGKIANSNPQPAADNIAENAFLSMSANMKLGRAIYGHRARADRSLK